MTRDLLRTLTPSVSSPLFWTGTVGIVIILAALAAYFIPPMPPQYDEAAEQYLKDNSTIIAAKIAGHAFKDEEPLVIAAIAIDMSQQTKATSCRLPDLGDPSARPDDVRCHITYVGTHPLHFTLDAPLNVTLDWEHRDWRGISAPVALSAEPVPSRMQLEIHEQPDTP